MRTFLAAMVVVVVLSAASAAEAQVYRPGVGIFVPPQRGYVVRRGLQVHTDPYTGRQWIMPTPPVAIPAEVWHGPARPHIYRYTPARRGRLQRYGW